MDIVELCSSHRPYVRLLVIVTDLTTGHRAFGILRGISATYNISENNKFVPLPLP